MSEPSLELQGAMVAALKGASPPVSSGRVYDDVPENPVFPYISMGPCQVLPDKASCIDGSECYPQLDAWSRAVGFPEVKRIVKEVLAALDDRELVVPGFQLVLFEYVSVNYFHDPDGKTRHAAITFHALLQPL